jgi:carbonic anhydrase/acetyltransferase-like protein (isoleucine patch superfamily)
MSDVLQPMCADYNGTSPQFGGAPAFAGEGAVVLGRTVLGGGAWLGAWSVIRADGHDVRIGADFHLGEHGTVHIAHDVYPTRIGDGVTAGNGAVIHACTVDDGCVVESDAVILDGSHIGAGAVIAAGSVVFPRSELDGGWLYAGSPAKPVERLSESALAERHRAIRKEAAPESGDEGGHDGGPQTPLDCFVAPSARVTGKVVVGDGVGIWYGCHLDAGQHRIVIGEGTNVQDNSVLTCDAGDLVIGRDVTIGHNVTLSDCVIEPDSLIGIGSLIAPGTTVESDVLVAAGTRTEPGQRLTAGQVWAGRPARPIGRMDERKRNMLAATLPTYRDYAARFRATPHRPMVRRTQD